MGKSTITFKGDRGSPKGHYFRTVFWDVTDATALNTLASLLVSHTGCHLAKTSFPLQTIVNDVAPGASANVDKRAVIYIRDDSNGKVFNQEYPAPKAADVESLPQGDRIKSAALTTIVAAIATATGKSLTALWGKVIQRG